MTRDEQAKLETAIEEIDSIFDRLGPIAFTYALAHALERKYGRLRINPNGYQLAIQIGILRNDAMRLWRTASRHF